MKWITRERARVDRIACPWLISRFIDPDAGVPVRAGRRRCSTWPSGRTRSRTTSRTSSWGITARSAPSMRSSSGTSSTDPALGGARAHRPGRRHRRPRPDAGVGGALRGGDRLPGHQPGRLRQHGAPVPDVRRAVRVLPGAGGGAGAARACCSSACMARRRAWSARRTSAVSAAARGLAIDAVAAGTEPDRGAGAGRGEGARRRRALPATPARPRPVTLYDLDSAARVVSFGCDVAPARGQRVDQWDVPAVSDGYEAARGPHRGARRASGRRSSRRAADDAAPASRLRRAPRPREGPAASTTPPCTSRPGASTSPTPRTTRSTSSTSRHGSMSAPSRASTAVAGALVCPRRISSLTSNRGENTIGIFAARGRPTPPGPQGGRRPAAQRARLRSAARARCWWRTSATRPCPGSCTVSIVDVRARQAVADLPVAGPHSLGRLRSGGRRVSRQHRRSPADRRRRGAAIRSRVRRVAPIPTPAPTGWTSTSRGAGCSARVTPACWSRWMPTAAQVLGARRHRRRPRRRLLQCRTSAASTWPSGSRPSSRSSTPRRSAGTRPSRPSSARTRSRSTPRGTSSARSCPQSHRAAVYEDHP